MLHHLGLRLAPGRFVGVSNTARTLIPSGRGSILPSLPSFNRLCLRSPGLLRQNGLATNELTYKRSMITRTKAKAGLFLQNSGQQRLSEGSHRYYGQNFRRFGSPSPFTPFVFFGAVCILIVVVPFVFTFLFPLIIAALITYQFKKRKTTTILKELHRSLQSSTKKVEYSTIMGLQSRMFGSLMEKEQFSSGVFGDLVNEFKLSQLDMSRTRRELQDLFNYLNARVLDAFETNEFGVREYFLGNDVSSWVDNNYDLKIDFDAPQIRGQILENTLVMIIKFPLLLESSNQPPKKLASVAIAFQDRSLAEKVGSFRFLEELARTDKQCPMVTTILPYRTLSTRQFILKDKGHDLLSVKRTSEGHREFTYRK
ncbi:LAFA_0G06018g1_1 [Lachancea sp. 'fantastica']|nr:LAFA_0G06018g1_1 [Lachancea sp. 'fantastica']